MPPVRDREAAARPLYADKPVIKIMTEAVDKIVVGPRTLIRGIAVDVPSVQETVDVRGEAQFAFKDITDLIPKVQMQYVEKVGDIDHVEKPVNKIMTEAVDKIVVVP